jgi:hypothetical protein
MWRTRGRVLRPIDPATATLYLLTSRHLVSGHLQENREMKPNNFDQSSRRWVSFWVEREDVDTLKARARELDRSMSSAIRVAIKSWLNGPTPPPGAPA